MLFDDLLFQALHRVELIDPWRTPQQQPGAVGSSLLAGGVVLYFDDVALVCTSPLRTGLRSKGTAVALASGGIGALGYCLTLMDVGEAQAIASPGLYRRTVPGHELPIAREANDPLTVLLLDLAEKNSAGACTLRMRLLGGGWCELAYRSDLDGCIELVADGQGCEVECAVVSGSDDTLGYLSPVSAYPFALDGACWKSAHPRDWPWPLAREWRSQPNSSEYRQVMKAALLARFQQHPALRRRLLALQCAVSVAGVPAGLIEEVACLLREERLVEDCYA